MRIKKNINLVIISWFNTKFAELTLQELYGWCEKNYKFDLGVEGLIKYSRTCTYNSFSSLSHCLKQLITCNGNNTSVKWANKIDSVTLTISSPVVSSPVIKLYPFKTIILGCLKNAYERKKEALLFSLENRNSEKLLLMCHFLFLVTFRDHL